MTVKEIGGHFIVESSIGDQSIGEQPIRDQSIKELFTREKLIRGQSGSKFGECSEISSDYEK